LLTEGDTITVAAGSHLDLAYDKQWKNITRFRENSRITIRSIFPTDLSMDYGEIFAKLTSLPKNSTFEIETPTAIAAVRGSGFLTRHRDNVTSVLNHADSPVYVFGLETDEAMEKPVILEMSQKTQIDPFEPPTPPETMSDDETQEGQALGDNMDQHVKDIGTAGRIGQLPEIQDIASTDQETLERKGFMPYVFYLITNYS